MKIFVIIAIVAVAMIGMMVPSISAEETPSWTKEKLLEQKIPTWMNSVGVLLVEDKITNDEFRNMLNFLIEDKIISPEQTSFKIFVTGIELYSNYNTVKNSELNLLSNSDAFDIFKYDTRQECLEDILKNNQKTILNIKKCGKIIEDHTKTPKIYDTTKHILENRYNPKIYDKLGFEIENKLDARDFGTRDECIKEAQSDGKYDILEKTVCDKVNRTWAVDTIIYDDYGNKVGTQALNNCNDSNCNTDYQYGNYQYGNYGYDFNMDAEVQYALNRADYYAYQSLDAVDTYANQWVNGQISYGEYERKAMSSMEYYGNQYAYEMEGYWDSKYP